MKKILCLFPGLALVLALAGCCANTSCNCQDEQADALFFRFYTDNPTTDSASFKLQDVTTVYLRRYNRSTGTKPDSVALVRTIVTDAKTNTSRIANDTIVINNTAPFALAGTNRKLNAYDYSIAVNTRSKKRYEYLIQNIKLTGRYNANGCCTCYENTGKTYVLNTVPQEVTDSPGSPRIVLLRRYR